MPSSGPQSDAASLAIERLTSAVEALRGCGVYERDAAVGVQVANALDPTYDLWEFWIQRHREPGKPKPDAQDRLIVTPEGETAAALVYARGEKSHAGVVFGRIYRFGEGPFGQGPFGGGWHWQTLPPATRGDLATRAGWYATHVAGRRPLRPLETAVAWFRAELELKESAPQQPADVEDSG